jgi:short-subunit dehydrogenase
MNRYLVRFVSCLLVPALLGTDLICADWRSFPFLETSVFQSEALSTSSLFHTHAPLLSHVVFITGASSGIGAALARELAGQGASVVLAARRQDRLNQVVQEIRQAGGRAMAVVCDVAVESQVEQAVQKAVEAFGGIDIVVANAGIGAPGLLHEVPLDRVRHIIGVNILGTTITIATALPQIMARKGQIVIIGSVMGFCTLPGWSLYTMTKHALAGLAKSLYVDLKPFGVNVLHVAPPYVRTEFRQQDRQGHFDQRLKDPVPGWMVLPADKVARRIADAIDARKREVIFSWYGNAAVWISRLFPWAVSGLAGLASFKRNDQDPPSASAGDATREAA